MKNHGGRKDGNGSKARTGIPELRKPAAAAVNAVLERPASASVPGNGTLPRHLVEVTTKYGTPDSTGTALLGQLPLLGIQTAKEIRVSTLYEITGKLSPNQMQQMSRDLLSDPITQEYRVERDTPSRAFLMGPHWRAEVWLKPTVTDPVGESVCKAVKDLGLPEPAAVRTGMAYHIIGRLNKAQAERIVEKLLSNPVIHRTTLIQR